MDFNALVTGLATNPFPAITALLILAIAWMYKEGRAQEREHRESLTKILPLTEKLTDAIEVLERVMNKG